MSRPQQKTPHNGIVLWSVACFVVAGLLAALNVTSTRAQVHNSFTVRSGLRYEFGWTTRSPPRTRWKAIPLARR